MRYLISGVLTSALLGFTCTSAASDTGLYGVPAPADAIFVRWIGKGTPWEQPLWGISFEGQDLPANTYVAISASVFTEIGPGGYYSVIEGQENRLIILPEPPRERTSRVHLLLLNTGPALAALTVSGSGLEVIGGIAPMSTGTRAVNPVTASLRVETPQDSQDFDVALRRGQNISFVVLEDQIMMIPNTFGPVAEIR